MPFVPWLIGLAGRWWWFAELFTHFRFQWLLGTGAIGLVLLFARQWVPLALCGVAALILGGPLLRGAFFADETLVSEFRDVGIRVVTANVLTRNRNAALLLDYLDDVEPDVLCLQEIDARWAEDLEPLYARYPYRRVEPRPDNFGMAVFSKRPATFNTIDCGGVPLIRCTVEMDDGRPSLTIYNVHTFPPIGAEYAALRNRQMAQVADLAAWSGGPVLVGGDLNCTPWSPHFADLRTAGGLDDPRLGGRGPTSWRAGNPLFALPIDHLLPGGGAGLMRLRAGPDIGSDHRPLSARVFTGSP
ncbi:endonuclease/exonuclease/phosphatase family protein [Alienimonas californiensis]|uniref:Endonuclease/Exonuclease/phosphatase family protein n=1 Tax=Alienimonas californiensis TaxID=2527989 RepID=A0A517P9Q4_9PLAN|nr:endonuclease/exonuclease/phosphatase family protein [Alienimonas californiensis]QDT16099.1 Endonuclease/Exonuclease/phosphatase family protein [Alienimonas californiensis]